MAGAAPTVDFEYDPNEPVSMGRGSLTLRSAMREFLKLPPGQRSHVFLPRDHGRVPSAFDASHLEALARLPEFADEHP